MSLQSYAECPSCDSQITLRKREDRLFVCPRCQAVFRHNYKRWALAIPIMAGVTLTLFYLVPGLGVWIILGAIFVTALLTGRMPEYIMVAPGGPAERTEIQPSERESTFFKVSIFCFLVIALVSLGWSLRELFRNLF